MSTKQLYEKTSEGMKEVNPLVAIEDIYSKLSDTPLEALVSLYNHVKCEWKGSVADTRRTVPLFLRRSGLFITYNNGTKYITEFFSAGTDQITTEGWVKDSNWTSVPDEDYISAGVKPGVGSIGYEQLNDNLKKLFREKVNVTNYPDDEDIVSVDNMLKLKDREVDAALFQSKGYVILRKNLCLVNGTVKNILTQDMINQPNTIYEIRYDFDLNSNIINIQEGCTIKFKGGSLINGTLNGNVLMCGYGHTDCNITKCEIDFDASLYITPNNKENTAELQRVLNIAGNISGKVYFSKTLDIYYSNKVCVLSNSIIDFKNVTLIQHGIGSTFMNIGNSKETYDDENIQLYNITARSYERAARGRVFWFEGVRNLIIENFNYVDSCTLETESGYYGAWAITISGYNITLRNIIINNYEGGLYYDGIHFEFVENVLVDGFQINSGDDCVAIHPQWDPPFDKNINIPNCVNNVTIQNGHGKTKIAALLRIGYSNLSKDNTSFYIKNVFYNNITQEGGKRSNIIETLRHYYNNYSDYTYKISDITFNNIKGLSVRDENAINVKINYDDNVTFNNCIFDCGDSYFTIRTKHLKINNCTFISKSLNNGNIISADYSDIYNSHFITNNSITINNAIDYGTYSNFVNNFCNVATIIINHIGKVTLSNNNFDINGNSEALNITDASEFRILYNSIFFKCHSFISNSVNKDRNNKLYFIGNFVNNTTDTQVEYLISTFTDIKYKYGCFFNNIINITNASYSIKDFAETIDYDDSLPYEANASIPSTSLNNCKIKKIGTKPYIYLDNAWKEISIVNQ